jgi:hypothetical protein
MDQRIIKIKLALTKMSTLENSSLKTLDFFFNINLSEPFLQQSESINNLNRYFVQYHVMSERN